ncbi:MAG: chloride channel protein [Planctomycetota bacterium]
MAQSQPERPSKLAIRGIRFRVRMTNILTRAGIKEEYFLVLVSILIGATTGLFAQLFYDLIEGVRHVAFGPGGDAGLFNGRWWMLILLPTVGGLAVGMLTFHFAREAKGHGVPEVMDSIYRKGGAIRGRVAGVKAVASSLTIGSGGSAGTEGPIIQIGAALGSTAGMLLGISRRQMGVVVACGVSAGIAAIFNAPIAGVLFALEVFLKDFSFRTFSPVVFSSVISCSIMHALKGEDVAIFEVSALRHVHYVFNGMELPWFLILGVLVAVASVAFIRALYSIEDLADKIPLPEPVKPALGGMVLGITGVIFLSATGTVTMPGFFGNGYPAIEHLLSSEVLEYTVPALLGFLLLKILATCLTLGSGGSGGVFAPSLLMGATLGAGYGMLLHELGVIEEASISAYALVGMGAMVAGTTHSPLTAIVMLYEITREPKVILPVMFAAIVSTFGAQALMADSIYTLKLRRRGVRIGSVNDLTLLRKLAVEDVEYSEVHFVNKNDPLQDLLDKASETDALDFVVVDEEDGSYVGMVTAKDIRVALLEPEAVFLLNVDELVRTDIPTAKPAETLDRLLDKLSRSDVESLPVSSPGDDSKVIGLVTRHSMIRRYQQEIDRAEG